jgi:hypothetical protein
MGRGCFPDWQEQYPGTKEHNYLVRVTPEPEALERQERDRKDIEIIDRHAERLNREAMDTLDYQQLS